jgi:(1->4)-alpha-D-glucan 1-alpha-D-glucosylmutase
VDYDARRSLLKELPGLNVADVCQRADEGLPKLWLIYHTLRVRREHPEIFGPKGKYQALKLTGAKAAHVLGFLRRGSIAVLVPRLLLKANGGSPMASESWTDTALHLPAGKWRNAFTDETFSGGELRMDSAFAGFPVALLIHQ